LFRVHAGRGRGEGKAFGVVKAAEVEAQRRKATTRRRKEAEGGRVVAPPSDEEERLIVFPLILCLFLIDFGKAAGEG